ncbi:hypothetical protein IQ02_02482 [Flavobacterium glaciei]|uniref:Uncharacterized protein n=1 Tax=Flavobacterium glaciei TaxID=386300 RepID=A0A562PJV8_9FLAO|nr:hypothetical protein DFR66_11624 [Flavobacterium glaciei]TWI44707.1 hypothetical protein IQ02_02482 [Flavobacterium glaciei]
MLFLIVNGILIYIFISNLSVRAQSRTYIASRLRSMRQKNIGLYFD